MILKKKSLGQHFLRSPKIISDIVLTGNINENDTVLEIGPGEGVLTSELLKTKAKIISIEKDDRLIPILQKKFTKEITSKKLDLIHDDILNIDIKGMLFNINDQYKVVANIPYYITGQIIRIFLEEKNKPESITLLIQKEVAERIVAKDGKESLLSLSVKAYGEPKYIRTVGRGAFNPPPTVDSAVLNIENISSSKFEGVSDKLFFKILHAGFAHKRKQLLPNLTSLYEKESLTKAFEKCDLNLKSRAEDLTLETWIKLCKILEKNV